MQHVRRSSIVMTNSGHISEPLHLYYLKNMISACRLSMQRVFTTDKGAIQQLPFVDIDKVIATQGRSTKWDIPPSVRMSQYEKYLATLNCFVINFEKGAAFVEVQEPLRDLAGFMATRNREYTCTSCGAAIQAPNDNDHTGTACGNCGKTTTQRINNCDIEANMKRFKSLIEYVKEIS